MGGEFEVKLDVVASATFWIVTVTDPLEMVARVVLGDARAEYCLRWVRVTDVEPDTVGFGPDGPVKLFNLSTEKPLQEESPNAMVRSSSLATAEGTVKVAVAPHVTPETVMVRGAGAPCVGATGTTAKAATTERASTALGHRRAIKPPDWCRPYG